MADEYSVTTCRTLEEAFRSAGVLRPMRIGRYDSGRELTCEVTGVSPAAKAVVRVAVEKFVGGGFAGQVYRVRVLDIDGETISGLEVGKHYALKILIPPSNFSQKFRDAIYKIGFQGDFSLQVNPAAARAGAIWQKLIRRAAKIRFGNERCVVDVLGTFFDDTLGACGEISEWIDGRNWLFEVNEYLGLRKGGSPEYHAKKTFMADMVGLLHEMGAPELARQYEWWTAKSQPNVLKRLDADGDADPSAGLTAVDFRAGLALLPFLPMSPVDFKLIFKGIARGSLVQFDRPSMERLRQFIDANAEDFADLRDALAELEICERAYRNSLPDITHHHVRLLYSRRLWSGILDSAVDGWEIRNVTDKAATTALRRSRFLTLLFAMCGLVKGLLPIAAVVTALASWTPSGLWSVVAWGTVAMSLLVPPMISLVAVALGVIGLALGEIPPPVAAVVIALAVIAPRIPALVRLLWGRGDYRRHYGRMLVSPAYFVAALRAHIAETLIGWHRAGRVGDRRAMKLNARPWRLLGHLPLSVLPASLHRILTDKTFAAEKLRYIFVRPIRLFFNAEAREQWLRDMVAEGRKKHMLSEDDAERILSRIKEPFIQKYLKSLAVHICTLPITQIVSVTIAIIYVLSHPEMPRAQAWGIGAGIIALFQVIPISPGSLVRGFYVLYLVIRERNFKDYNIAVFLGFFKYVGYLAFPIQMAYHYPALARFMAGHWATEAVHVVPVFGEHGALMEHGVFDLFYNWPLTVRRRMRKRTELRAEMKPRTWHVIPIAIVVVAMFGAADVICRNVWSTLPTLWNIRPVTVLLPLLVGAAATLGAGGKNLAGRIKLTMICAAATAVGYTAVHTALTFLPALGGSVAGAGEVMKRLGATAMWSGFLFTLLATVAALLTEINLPEPKTQNHL